MEKFKFDKKTNELFKAIISLKNINEAERFFRDLCTIDEIKEMSERWQIVKMLDDGLTYRDIAKKLDVSTTTVARVALWLNNGAGGYRLVFNRLNTHHNSSNAFKKS
jgi:TrpR-related protein YerC/YecD